MVVKPSNPESSAPAKEASTATRPAAKTRARKPAPPVVNIPDALAVQQLADLMKVSGIEVIKQLMRRGVMAGINQVIDYETASTVASDFGYVSHRLQESKAKAAPAGKEAPRKTSEEDASLLVARAPVVTILGHVDHGKTTLLDVIRNSAVAASEKGGITQHIGAYQVTANDQPITFLDTPGHEAFTAMRARGAQITDIAVLVVAADDGVMPQTREAIDHAKAAKVPIVVAINKIDLGAANVDRVKQQLSDLGLVPEEWGGETIMVPVSARTQEGIKDLLETILLVAEVSELKANPQCKAQGVVVEAKLDAARGAVATVLVQSGTLRVGDTYSVGNLRGKVRAMYDHRGHRLAEAGPAVPVEVLGIEGVPRAGDALVADQNGRKATLSDQRDRRKTEALQDSRVDIEKLLAQVRSGEAKDVNIVMKTDVEGSGEAIRSAMVGLGTDKVTLKILRSSSGIVTESDVLLAAASKATILAFNTRVDAGARRLADLEGVSIRFYDIIYRLVEDMQALVSGLVEPTYREVIEARAVVKEVFKVKGGKVAGIGVTEGKLTRNAQLRVLREGDLIHEAKIKSLHHFKDSVRELPAGSEGGVGVEGFDDFQVGDTLEAFRKERVEAPG